MKLFGQIAVMTVGLSSALAQDCALDDRKYNFYGCIIKRDGLTYPGDNGTSVFDSATCKRAVCLKTKEKFYEVSCSGGKLNIPDDFCRSVDDEIVEGILPNLGERLSTSGPSGSAHKTESTQQQPNPADYPGSFGLRIMYIVIILFVITYIRVINRLENLHVRKFMLL
jgi:hypothetical protein